MENGEKRKKLHNDLKKTKNMFETSAFEGNIINGENSCKTLSEKLIDLQNNIKNLGRVAVAFSGGVDSTLLLAVAKDVLGSNVLAITASSLVVPEAELIFTKTFTKELGVDHKIFAFDELSVDDFKNNTPERCYFCKREILGLMLDVTKEYKIDYLIEGTNSDDASDYRPGSRAILELGVMSPLRDSDLSKLEIRQLSKVLNLPTWDKPSNACFASRFPYGEGITKEKLKRVELAEEFLKSFNLGQLRVRSHGDLARIEVGSDVFSLIFENDVRLQIERKLKELGYKYVALDLTGYRTGSMNEALK